jgi:hypothetical protein
LIRKVTAAGVVTTYAGSGGNSNVDGARLSATFESPYGIIITSSNVIYIGDSTAQTVRKIA